MQKNKYASFKKYTDVQLIFIFIISALLFIGLSMNDAHANFESTESSNIGMCPANHKMYYMGVNAPTSTATFPVTAIPLSWTAGNSTRTFTFNETSGNKTFNINFSSILDKNNSEGAPPFYGSIAGSTSSALNLVHNSTSTETNHILNISTNRSVSKTGYKIQDVDSLTVNIIIGYGTFWGYTYPIYGDRTPYIEQIDVSANNGRLTFNNAFHTANNPAPNTSIVTGIEGRNCAAGDCTIDAAWNYKTANSALNLKHNNTLNETGGAHAIGYSDFYFCLAPPKIIVKKKLSGTRINTDDQFEMSTNQSTTTLNSFTTTGTGATVTNDSSPAIALREGTSYTVTERVMNGTTLGDISNYNTTYTCNNATTGSTTVMPTAAMTYNATAKTRSFTLANTTYGDEITCTITNASATYTFSGTVFNDNGGITEAQADATNDTITSGTYNNANYFNGIFDLTIPSETGIAGSTVKLVDCSNPSTTYATQAVSATGSYQINASATTLNSNSNNICLIEERSGNTYPLRTNSDRKTITFATTTYNYPNNNFGRVIAENVALVLKKHQYINNCPSTLNYTSINDSPSPVTGFSTASIENIVPGKCIAYKITAINRANVKIDDFVMRDVLQKKGVSSAIVTSVLANPASASADYASDSVAIDQNGTVKTKTFILDARSKRDFYFNTKYGTTANQ